MIVRFSPALRLGARLSAGRWNGVSLRRSALDWPYLHRRTRRREVVTRRSKFAAILRTNGVDGLSAALNRKADMLTKTMAEAFGFGWLRGSRSKPCRPESSGEVKMGKIRALAAAAFLAGAVSA